MIMVFTDIKIKDCSQCPLMPIYTRDCGEQTKVRGSSGSMKYGKIPNRECKIRMRCDNGNI